jgi:tRNA pseudouridine13 synthase
MKLKQQPEDFQVEEITRVVAGDQGPFALYRLEKKGWSTPDALAVIRRRWRIEPRRTSYGGLKDRHAQTVQYLSIFHGPRRHLNQPGIRVTYLGQVLSPYESADVVCNRFRLVLRDLSAPSADNALADLPRLAEEGVPNYFDDQRFGSVTGPGGEFIARLLVRGQWEAALRLALAGPYEFDRAEQKREKRILAECWGDWAACKDRLPRGHARSLVDYLRVHPGDFKGAVARLRPELRGLYLSAYQSHLWNRMLARWLHEHLRPEQLVAVRLRLGEVPMHNYLDEDQRRKLVELRLPLPSARMRLEENDPHAALVHSVLAEEGLEVRGLQIKGIREMFFSRGERAALCVPSGLEGSVEADERRPGRKKLTLAFELPRGSYATLIVKRLTAVDKPASRER